jgi:benzoyl-CoA reductase/2-hydroxyglutaryl-CoA dehydratase subunit BcrC/BadD/HgdB
MKRVVYTCPFIPAEWLSAHGVRPSRIMPDPIPAGAAPRSGVCPYAWAFMQTALADDGADAVVFTTRCDQMRRASELAARDTDKPVFLLNMPATWQTPAPRGLYASELGRLGRFLVEIGGRAPSAGQVRAEAERYEAVRAVLRERSGTAPAASHWEALAAFNRDGTCALDAPPTGKRAGGVRLALVGAPMMRHERALLDLIGEAGGTVVLDATVSGELGMPAPLDPAALAADPFEALVDAYFGGIPDASRRPNEPLYRWLAARLGERGVQGIVYRHYTWCDTWHGEGQRLKERAGLPLVVTVADAEGQVDRHSASRIQALIEMLK